MKCRIKTITPCHIGTGEKLIAGMDFVADGDRVGIVSPEKIYALLGEDGVDRWCYAIERGEDTRTFIKTQKLNAKLEDICSRVMELHGSRCNELAPQIATCGVPYIPGSSIKGAIVSAIVGENSEKISLPDNIKKKNNIVAEQLLVKPTEKRGKTVFNPTNSNLRFLRVGDAHFEGATTVAIESYGLNLREQKSIIDKDGRMLIECIKKGQAVFEVQIARELHDKCGSTVLPFPEAMASDEKLLRAINRHTQRLLEEELRFWEEQKKRDYYHIDEDEEQKALDYYIKKIGGLLQNCRSCRSGEEAILRVGYGSGWRFMTGGWIDKECDMWDDVATTVRQDWKSHKYDKYDFPKTRRIGFAPPFGFVKLTQLD